MWAHNRKAHHMDVTPLRKAREDAKITLPRMAEITGEDKGNLSRAERGEVKQASTIRAVAMLYDYALMNEPYTLARECGVLPATLIEYVNHKREEVVSLIYRCAAVTRRRSSVCAPNAAVA